MIKKKWIQIKTHQNNELKNQETTNNDNNDNENEETNKNEQTVRDLIVWNVRKIIYATNNKKNTSFYEWIANHTQHLELKVVKRNSYIEHWYQLFTECVQFYGEMATLNQIFDRWLNIKLLFASFNPKCNCSIIQLVTFVLLNSLEKREIILALKSNISDYQIINKSFIYS